jgi:hypothetical protein
MKHKSSLWAQCTIAENQTKMLTVIASVFSILVNLLNYKLEECSDSLALEE